MLTAKALTCAMYVQGNGCEGGDQAVKRSYQATVLAETPLGSPAKRRKFSGTLS